MIAPSKKSAPAPEATKLCEVWEAGECVFMADNRRQAEAWAKAHQIRGYAHRCGRAKGGGLWASLLLEATLDVWVGGAGH